MPGDALRVSVAFDADTDVYLLDDLTTGAHFSSTDSSPAGAEGASAECIAEAPTGAHGLEPLADFGSATFGGCEATVAGTAGVTRCELISGTGCPKVSDVTIDQIQGHVLHFIPIHKASVASTGRGAFTVTWRHA